MSELPQAFLFLISVAAGIGGAIAGWLIAGPATRLLYRLAFQRPVPRGLLPWTKMGGALALGFLLFSLVSLGTGRGWGWGHGTGGGPGLGPGLGGGPGPGKDGKNGKDQGKDGKEKTPPTKSDRTELDIELISSEKYKKDGKYYLLKSVEPALSLAEVEEYFEKNHEKIQVNIVLTETSVGAGQGAVGRLRELTKKYKIPTTEPPE